jgi:hypothetical protein
MVFLPGGHITQRLQSSIQLQLNRVDSGGILNVISAAPQSYLKCLDDDRILGKNRVEVTTDEITLLISQVLFDAGLAQR